MTTLLELGREGRPLTNYDITDMHGHLGRYASSIPEVTAESIVRVMARTGVARTVVAGMLPSTPHETEADNRRVLEAMREYPGRILGYLRVCPAAPKATPSEAEKLLAQGFVGLKLHNHIGVEYTHPAYEPYLAAANARRMPVLLHTWGQKDEFNQVRQLARRYPELSWLMAHAGCSSESQYCDIARSVKNVYLETALSMSPRGLVARLAERAGADKVVWGSDVCFINQAQQLGKILGAHLPEADKEAILSKNAQRILGRVAQI